MKKTNLSLFEKAIELYYWIRIVLSPVLFGAIISTLIYLYQPNAVGVSICFILMVLSVVVGVIWANKIYSSKRGLIWFFSRLESSSESDPQIK